MAVVVEAVLILVGEILVVESVVAEEAPLPAMNLTERIGEDFCGTGLTAGDHPMRLVRDRLPEIWRAVDPAAETEAQCVCLKETMYGKRKFKAEACVVGDSSAQ